MPPTTTAAPTPTTAATTGTPADDGVDDPPVIDSVTVSPTTVCRDTRFTLTVVAHDDSGDLEVNYEYTISYPSGTGMRWSGALTRGPNDTWTAQVGDPDGGTLREAGTTITGYVAANDGVHFPTQQSFPITVHVVNC